MNEIMILYVDDDFSSFFMDLISCKIKKKIRLFIASSGKEALKILSEKNIHIVFLDYSLPDMNGLELIEKMRREREGLLIVMITKYGNDKIATEAMKKGALDYIAKNNRSNEELADSFKSYIDLAFQLCLIRNAKCNDIRKKRDVMEIVHSLLKNAIGGIKKTRLLYKSNLNTKTLEKYLSYCIKQGYIQIRGENKLYITTEKGREALEKLREASELLA